MLVFLDLNGYQVRWDRQEALDFVLRLADGQVELQGAVRFLHSRVHPRA